MLKFLLSSLLCVGVALAAPHKAEASSLDGRIVGGNDTSIIDYPYQVSIEYLGSYYCGGAIIARTWILTGASCIQSSYPISYHVRVATSYRGVGGYLLSVATLVPHANYSTTNFDFDIGLIQLADPVPLSLSAQIIGLPINGDGIEEGAIGTVAGWGFTEEGGTTANVLQVVEVPVVSHSVCRDFHSEYFVSDRMFCAGVYEGGRDSCSGDGGSPLVIDSVASGIVSWGLGCGRPRRPGVYTNVGLFRDWITEKSGI